MVVLCYVDDDGNAQQRVCKLRLLAKSLAGKETAQLLIETESTKLGIVSANIVAAIHDQASVNNVAMHTVKVSHPKIFDVGCYSHTLDRVGEKMVSSYINEFIKGWVGLLSKSPKTCLARSTFTGPSPPKLFYSEMVK